jgi:predicted lipoprotein with Yx(FWY)xxD motif
MYIYSCSTDPTLYPIKEAHMKSMILFVSLIGLALALSACGAAASTPPPTAASAATDTVIVPVTGTATDTAVPPAATMAPTTAVTGGTAVMVGQNATLGSFLVDSKGMTLYIFTNDAPGTSNCNAGCISNWPPMLTTGAPTAGDGVTASMLGTATRSDGTTQVTYNGWPLYYFIADKAAGDTNGEGKAGSWYVMTPAGTQK